MAGITLSQAQSMLALYLEALEAVLANQEYTLPGGRRITRANLSEVEQGVTKWESKVQRLSSSGGIRAWGATPL